MPGCRAPGKIAHQADSIAHHNRGTAELARSHRGDLLGRVIVEYTSPASAVHGDHHRGRRIGMIRPDFGARPRAPTRTDAGVGLVVLAWAQEARSDCAIMSAHIPGKSGSVLLVVAMSSTETPGTFSPTSAPAVAIR